MGGKSNAFEMEYQLAKNIQKESEKAAEAADWECVLCQKDSLTKAQVDEHEARHARERRQAERKARQKAAAAAREEERAREEARRRNLSTDQLRAQAELDKRRKQEERQKKEEKQAQRDERISNQRSQREKLWKSKSGGTGKK